MKNLIAIVLLVVSASTCYAQCNTLQSAVSSSTDTQVVMNSNAFFVLPPGEENDILWELRDFNDNLLDDDNTGIDFPIFVFDVPLTDSLSICQTVTNEVAGIVCQVCDTLIHSGSILHWELISSNTGVITSTNQLEGLTMQIYPNPAVDFIRIDVQDPMDYRTTIYDLTGKKLFSDYSKSILSIGHLPKGIYLLEIQDRRTGNSTAEKIVKW